jgi:hypothetical protein
MEEELPGAAGHDPALEAPGVDLMNPFRPKFTDKNLNSLI